MTETVGNTLATVLGVLWGVGILIGPAFWFAKGDLVNAILSVVIPAFGFVSVAVYALY